MGKRREIQKVRASSTSARSCSAAEAFFFIAKSRPAKEARKGSRACLHASLLKQSGEFWHGDVGALLHAGNQKLAMVRQFAAARGPPLFRGDSDPVFSRRRQSFTAKLGDT